MLWKDWRSKESAKAAYHCAFIRGYMLVYLIGTF